METEFITIPLEKFKELVSAQVMLNCLEHNGVDNWDWYGESMDGWHEFVPRDDNDILSKGYYKIVDDIVKKEVQKYCEDEPKITHFSQLPDTIGPYDDDIVILPRY
jgi:hypothetical protein